MTHRLRQCDIYLKQPLPRKDPKGIDKCNLNFHGSGLADKNAWGDKVPPGVSETSHGPFAHKDRFGVWINSEQKKHMKCVETQKIWHLLP